MWCISCCGQSRENRHVKLLLSSQLLSSTRLNLLRCLQLSTTGLDQAMKQFFVSCENVIMAQPSEVNLEHPDFEYLWEVSSISCLSPILVVFRSN